MLADASAAGVVRVLLVEDSPDDALAIERQLARGESQRFELVTVQFGHEALDRCRADPPDCLLLDYHLPDMTGLDVLVGLRDGGDSVAFAVVMLTGGTGEMAETTLRFGADDYLVKGELTAPGLRRAIENAIEKARLRRERAAAETALRESEQRLQLVIDASEAGIWEWDLSTGSAFWSDRVYEMLGLVPGALPAGIETVTELIHPDDRERFTEVVRAHLEDNAPYQIELRMRRADGSYGWFQGHGKARRDASGRPIRMAGSLTDITARKSAEQALRASERRLRLAVAAARVGTWDVAPLTGELTASEQALAIHGLPPDVPMTHERALLVVEPEDRPHVEGALRQSLEAGVPLYIEYRVRHPDGSLHWVESHAELDSTSTPPRLIGLVQDTTQRKAREQAQREFIANASHELRNPLAAIRGFAQLLQRRQAYGERPIQAIVSQTAQLDRLVGDLVDASRLELGSLDLRPDSLNLVEQAQTCVEEAQATSERHTIRLEAPDGPLEGAWDSDRLAQIFRNLLGNAIKYSPNGGEVLLRIADRGDRAELSIRDDGLGMDSEAIVRLFDRYYRAEGTASEVKGLGLGLYITKALVEAHGGQIWAESDGPGRGSTFRFTLPYQP